MLINADFTRRAALAPEHYQWVPSPQNGVERVMLDRVGAEKARATSIVRYAPESYFPHHMHPGGEEILVLSGTFSADDSEQVSLQRLKADEALFTDTIKGGAEILVLDGKLIDAELTDDAKTYTRGGWLRLPVDALPQIKAGVHGAMVYLKTGHLSKVIGVNVEEK
nr:cupin domain-containing protein [uncultured Psychrobacter sp.]